MSRVSPKDDSHCVYNHISLSTNSDNMTMQKKLHKKSVCLYDSNLQEEGEQTQNEDKLTNHSCFMTSCVDYTIYMHNSLYTH